MTKGIGRALAGVCWLVITSVAAAAFNYADPPLLPGERRVPKPAFAFPERELTLVMEAEAYKAFLSPITDDQGRIRYVIELADWATDLFSNSSPPVLDGMPEYHKPAMRNLAQHLASRYELKAVGLLSWLGNGLIAHLTRDQVSRLQDDPRVIAIRPDSRVRRSGALWSDSFGPQSQLVPWGTNAYGGSRSSSGNKVVVYVVDAGVGYHTDLPSVQGRRIAQGGSMFGVGCYSHATAVAGVIAGKNTAPWSVYGMNRATPIISYSVGSEPNALEQCQADVPEAFSGGVLAALDQIRADIFSQAYQGKQFIINISANSFDFISTGSIGRVLPQIANPSLGYDGALIVMSAGNSFKVEEAVYDNACDVAYEKHVNGDGIIVVGGFDENGQQAVRLNGIPAYRNGTLAGSSLGSNRGECVELWAPSKGIYTTWGASPQRGDVIYANHARLSGTSFSAPHISALAAWVQQNWGPVSPQFLETALRSYGHPLQSTDQSGLPIYLTWTPNLGTTTIKALPTVEFQVNGRVGSSPSFSTSRQFGLSFDSRGTTASYCNLSGYMNGIHQYTVAANPSYDWGKIQMAYPGTYEWRADCFSAHGTHNVGTGTVTITAAPQAPPSVYWQVNHVDRTNQTVWNASQSEFVLEYEGVGSDSCSISAEKGPYPGVLTPWYNVAGLLTAWDWDGPITLPPGQYKWTVTCTGIGTGSSFLHLISQ